MTNSSPSTPLLASVVVCSHNSRLDHLHRMLAGLKNQTLATEMWELLVIDNASTELLAKRLDISWHPRGRHIREDRLGASQARLCGIQEAQAELIVFVDDDNVLDADYLQAALRIADQYAFLGAWGAEILPEFESAPPEWTSAYFGMLAIRKLARDQWSNSLKSFETVPWGAGLCIRRTVALVYADRCRDNQARLRLGRRGKDLNSMEDCDLAYTACDMGLGTGLFKSLRLTHLIPPSRLEEAYLLRLTESIAYSEVLLTALRHDVPAELRRSFSRRVLDFVRLWKMNPRVRRFFQANKRGRKRGIAELQSRGNPMDANAAPQAGCRS